MDLAQFLQDTADYDPLRDKPRRVQVPRRELEARLAHYEAITPGFEATDEHLSALVSIFHDHRNVLVTGGAGVGKTTFIRQVVMPELDYRNLQWAVTATTGIAGSHLDGKTVHSFFGIGLGPEWAQKYPPSMLKYLDGIRVYGEVPPPQHMDEEELEAWYRMFYDRWNNEGSGSRRDIMQRIREGVKRRLRGHEVVLVDEISMMHGNAMLGYLEFMLREIRGNDNPFGGLQMVFVGDFAQLPPVETDDRAKWSDWAFLSQAWERANVRTEELTRVFRQGDPRFISFLNNIREGRMNEADRDYADSFVNTSMTLEETRNYTFLVPTNRQAQRINTDALQQYPAPTIPLTADFHIETRLQVVPKWEQNKPEGMIKEELLKALKRRLLDPITYVRIGYPVMITVNDREGRFVNGTRGFLREVSINPRDPEDPRDTDSVVVGVPDGRGGETLITLRRWRYSRSRDEDPEDSIPMPEECNQQREEEGRPKLPTYISKYPTVRQFPLIPAVAITVHKSQGMSMDTAILALARTFAPGHVYVGLSRLRSPGGMVLSERDFVVRTDPLVMDFYRRERQRRINEHSED